MKCGSVKVGTWPTPDKPVSVEIPVKYLREFGRDARFAIRLPNMVGIPIPLVFLRHLQRNVVITLIIVLMKHLMKVEYTSTS